MVQVPDGSGVVKRGWWLWLGILVLVGLAGVGGYYWSGISRQKRDEVKAQVNLAGMKASVNTTLLQKAMAGEKWFSVGVYPRPEGMVKSPPISKVSWVIDNNRYGYDVTYDNPKAKDKMTSSALEERWGTELVIHVGIDKDYLQSLSKPEAEAYMTKAIARTLVTISRLHSSIQDLDQDIDQMVLVMQAQGQTVKL